LERLGYRASCPLETIAYTLENVFRINHTPFDTAGIDREQLDALYSCTAPNRSLA
jgi:hypothetical protein